MIYDFIIANKEIFKIVYALIISFICAIIVLKSDRLFKISDYQGLRYFRNAFFFYGLAFIIRFILGSSITSNGTSSLVPPSVINFLFEFTILTAGFLLFYTLIWKKIEKTKSHNSLFNKNISAIYILSAVLSLLDAFLNTSIFLYASQILLFLLLSIFTYGNIRKSGGSNIFGRYYFITMIFGLIAWTLNGLLYYVLNWNKSIQLVVYALNIIFFIIIFYGTTKFSSTQNGKKTGKA